MKPRYRSISEYADLRMRAELMRSEKVRREALKRCYKIPGYVRLTLPEKNNVYDRVRDEVIKEMEAEK